MYQQQPKKKTKESVKTSIKLLTENQGLYMLVSTFGGLIYWRTYIRGGGYIYMDQNLYMFAITFCKQLLRFWEDLAERMVKYRKYGVDLIWQNLPNFDIFAKFSPPQNLSD